MLWRRIDIGDLQTCELIEQIIKGLHLVRSRPPLTGLGEIGLERAQSPGTGRLSAVRVRRHHHRVPPTLRHTPMTTRSVSAHFRRHSWTSPSAAPQPMANARVASHVGNFFTPAASASVVCEQLSTAAIFRNVHPGTRSMRSRRCCANWPIGPVPRSVYVFCPSPGITPASDLGRSPMAHRQNRLRAASRPASRC